MRQTQKKVASENEIYISVDVEASGPIPSKYSMLSIGACVVGNSDNNFYIEIKPINEYFVEKAVEISGFSIENLKTNGIDPEIALKSFSKWVEDVSSFKTPIFVGFNAPFDWQFVNWYLHVYTGANPFGINAVDIKAYIMGATHSSWTNTSSSNLPDWLKVKNRDKHNALSDAISQATIFERLLQRRE